MQRVLICLFVSGLAPSFALAGPGSASESAAPAAVSTTVAGLEVRAVVTASGRDVALSVGDGQKSVRVGLPDDGVVSEIRLTRWMSVGIAMAIETRNPQTKELSYFWLTAWVNGPGAQVATPNVSRFLKSKTDYDLVGVVNSQSDSIYVTLVRHVRGGETQEFTGFVYVNHCPVAAAVEGQLYPLTAGPAHAGAAKGQP